MKKTSKASIPLHPFLFALLPIISLLSYNIQGAAINLAFRPALLSLFGAAIVLSAFWLFLRNWYKAGVISSIFLMLFFSYGHVYGGFLLPGTEGVFGQGQLAGRHGVLLLMWASLFALAAFVVSRLKQSIREVSQLLNVIALVACAIPLWRIIVFEYNLRQPWPVQAFASPVNLPPPTSAQAYPDIYYIILDGYGREDILARDFNFDNSHFIDLLETQGFFVARRSQANYILTVHSLAASLNMNYLDFLSQDPGPDSQDPTPTSRLIRWSLVAKLLKERGYSLVAFSTGNRATEMEIYDAYYQPRDSAATVFERLVMDTSLFVIWHDVAKWLGWPELYLGYQAHRERINFALDGLAAAAEIPGPKFVFVHVIIPHPPFVFHADGTPVQANAPFSLMDGDLYLGTPEEYIQGYREQLTYINTRIEAVVQAILSNSSQPPVIILQGDHGPGAYLRMNAPDQRALEQRLPILNAYYVPQEVRAAMYDEISPVNTFRILFNVLFDAQLPLLPDKSYFTTLNKPYLFVEVSE